MRFLSRKSTAQIFLGKGANSKPVWLPLAIHDRGHTRIMGPTRFGKGLTLQTLLPQMLMLDRTVVVIEARKDDWLPHTLGHYCEESGIPFSYLDANSEIPQWAPLRGKDRNQALTILSTGFDIEPHGDVSDFHKLKDRAVADLIAGTPELRSLDWPSLYSQLLRDYSDEIVGAEGFMYSLREFAAEKFLQTDTGIDLQNAIEAGGVIYVTADLNSNIQMRVLKMFALSVLQTTIARGQGNGRRVELVLDEFRKLMSESTLNCLSMASANNTHAYVVHQSLGDIAQPVGALSAESVENIVSSNCRIRINFQSLDPNTAEYVSRMSGTTRIKRESATIDRNIVLNETKSGGAVLVEDEAPFIHPNVMISLPERCALLSLRGAPEFFYVCPVPTTQEDRFTTPTVFASPNTSIQNSAPSAAEKDLIDVDS